MAMLSPVAEHGHILASLLAGLMMLAYFHFSPDIMIAAAELLPQGRKSCHADARAPLSPIAEGMPDEFTARKAVIDKC